MNNPEQFNAFVEEYHLPIFKEIINEDYFSLGEANLEPERNTVTFEVPLRNDLQSFYGFANSWWMKWQAVPDIGIEGSINILPKEDVSNADHWDLLPDQFPQMKNFTLLDYFYNEGAVGFYLDKPEKGLFYFEFDADPRAIGLNFDGYLQMLKYTRGLAYWQKKAASLAAGNSIAEFETDKKASQLFPDYSIDGFTELYNKVKIK